MLVGARRSCKKVRLTRKEAFFSPLFSVEKEMVVTFNAEWGWSTWDKRHATFLHRGVWLCTLTGGVVPIVQKHRFWTRILGRQRLVRPVSLTRLSFVFSRCFSFRFGTQRSREVLEEFVITTFGEVYINHPFYRSDACSAHVLIFSQNKWRNRVCA